VWETSAPKANTNPVRPLRACSPTAVKVEG
jgi:hypothetical protein